MIGILFAAVVVLAVFVWAVRRYRWARRKSLCLECLRWQKNTCAVPERPNVYRCGVFVPEFPREDFTEQSESLAEDSDPEQFI
jgi:Ulp1 family protease